MSIIPRYIFEIASTLEEHGYEAYLAGGSIRNILLHKMPKDFDLNTNALPEEIGSLFPKSIMTNANFGTVLVMTTDDEGESVEVQITTYRSEKDYVGGRWPSHVEFTPNIEEDLKRRDFTINAMAVRIVGGDSDIGRINEADDSLDSLAEDIVKSPTFLDYFGGRADLDRKLIRAVGDPIERFTEDGLRSLRACRFASIYGFTIEEGTMKAISETLDIAIQVSKERVRDELKKIIEESPKPSVGLELMRESGLMHLFIPELLEGYGMEQNHFHSHDVYRHLLDTVDAAPKEVRFAALFHDIGKARTKSGEHFYSHDKVGAEMTREILTRLKFSNKFIDYVVGLVRWHMFYIPTDSDDEHVDSLKEKRDKHFNEGWSDASIRRMIRRVGGERGIDDLIKLRIADAVANPKSRFDPASIRELAQRVAEVRTQDSIMSTNDLRIDGHDLQQIGIPKGPMIKKVLEHLLELVTEDLEMNNRETLIEESKKFYESIS